MSLSYAFRPRSERERLRMAHVVREAPRVVGLGFGDDGWTAASLWIAGHVPVWAAADSPVACEAVLRRLGLPPLGKEPPDAVLAADLSWATPPGAPATTRLPAAEGPLVTVLTCTFNRARLIGEALASALGQSWPCEVLVVDDGSTDGTAEVLAGIPGVRVVRQEPNQGKPAALARGVAEARGDAILVLDDDDLLLPGAVQVLATALFADPDRVAVWADTVVFDDATGAPAAVHPACRLPPELVRRAVLQQIPAMPGAVLVRTSAWRAAGPLDPSLVRGQDMDLFLALSRVGPIVNVPLATFWYRSHDALRGSAAGQWSKRDTGAHRARFLSFVKPVFRARWAALAPGADRAEGHAWALGLWQRDLADEARAELARWPAPWSLEEAWVRGQLSVGGEGRAGPGVLVVADDGDEGALEATLAAHSRGDALWVDLEVPRDPLGSVRLYWAGTYGARERLGGWVKAPGPWRLALTSAPDWSATLADPGLLPDLRAPDAILTVAAVIGAPRPVRTRPGLGLGEGPVPGLAWRARDALAAGRPADGMDAIATLIEQLPAWRGGWSLAAEGLSALGREEEAAACRARARPG